MYIYAISLPYPSPLSSVEPIDGIPMDELRTKSRRKAITDAYRSGGMLTLTEENTEHIEQLMFYRYLKVGVGETITQAISECLKNCVFSAVYDFENLAQIHMWSQHRSVAAPLMKDTIANRHFTFVDFQRANSDLNPEDVLIAFIELLKHSVVQINEIK